MSLQSSFVSVTIVFLQVDFLSVSVRFCSVLLISTTTLLQHSLTPVSSQDGRDDCCPQLLRTVGTVLLCVLGFVWLEN